MDESSPRDATIEKECKILSQMLQLTSQDIATGDENEKLSIDSTVSEGEVTSLQDFYSFDGDAVSLLEELDGDKETSILSENFTSALEEGLVDGNLALKDLQTDWISELSSQRTDSPAESARSAADTVIHLIGEAAAVHEAEEQSSSDEEEKGDTPEKLNETTEEAETEFNVVEDESSTTFTLEIFDVAQESNELIEVYKKPSNEQISATSSKTSLPISRTDSARFGKPNPNSASSTSIRSSARSKIPRVDSSQQNFPRLPQRKTQPSLSFFSTSSRVSHASTKMTSSFHVMRRNSSKRTVREMETELKTLKKKYGEIRHAWNEKDAALAKIERQMFGIVGKIEQSSGKERPDDDLKEIKNFAAKRIGGWAESGANPSSDLSDYENALFEIDTIWVSTLKDAAKNSKDSLLIEQKISKAAEGVREKRSALLKMIQETIKNTQNTDMDNNELLKSEFESRELSLKKACEDSKKELDKMSAQMREIAEKHREEVVVKVRELEAAKAEVVRAQTTCNRAVKSLATKEREAKEGLAALGKEFEEISRREKDYRKKLEEALEKIKKLETRETQIKKSVKQECLVEEAARTKQSTEKLEKARIESKKLEKELKAMKIEMEQLKATLADKEEKYRQTTMGGMSKSGGGEGLDPEAEESAKKEKLYEKVVLENEIQLKNIADLQEKLVALTSAQSAAEQTQLEKFKSLSHWEKELCMREDRLYEQKNVFTLTDNVLKGWKKWEKRRDSPERLSPEAASEFCEVLESRQNVMFLECALLKSLMVELDEKLTLIEKREVERKRRQSNEKEACQVEQSNSPRSRTLSRSRSGGATNPGSKSARKSSSVRQGDGSTNRQRESSRGRVKTGSSSHRNTE